MSFNDDLGYPNWVSWHLKAQDIGDVERGQFVPDDTLPEGFKRITPKDYTGTGYDRGHLCPSKDRSDTTENNNATFLMSNIFPQAPGNNQGPWKDLEDYSRDLVRNEGKDLYIFAGPALDRAKSSHKRVGRGKVKLTVPEDTWKVIVVLPAGDGDPLSRINPQSRVIAIWMPNLDSLRGKDWKKFRTSVDEIERQTGYELLSNLPKSLQDTLESKIDTE
jgi:endonuclease G